MNRYQELRRPNQNLLKPWVALLIVSAIIWSCASTIGRAQDAAPLSTPALGAVDKANLHQALLDLTNPITVMCVAAHPDDEDGTTLTVLRRKHGVRTVSLFSTY